VIAGLHRFLVPSLPKTRLPIVLMRANTFYAGLCTLMHATTETTRYDTSPTEGEDDAEPHPAAVHLFVGFRHAIKRIFFDHRVHAGQCTECHRVL
jgi:hypothetical protein